MDDKILGIDFGGSGIKGAIVDIHTGEMMTERFRIPTPQPATPSASAAVFNEIIKHFNWDGPIGCGFPGLVKHGVVDTASNLSPKWRNLDAEAYLKKRTNHRIHILNDADAAGLAESKFGAGKSKNGIVFMITIGTGIGSALIHNGQLLPNTELGHIFMKNGKEAEHFASDLVRKRQALSWQQWALRFNKYLKYLDDLFSPDVFILGGGASKKFDKFEEFLSIKTSVVPAKLQNQAGIIGAAYFAHQIQ